MPDLKFTMIDLRASTPTDVDVDVKVQFFVSQYAGCPLGSLRRIGELNPDCTERCLYAVFGVAPWHAPTFLSKTIPSFGDLQSGLDGMSICQFDHFFLDGLPQISLESSLIEFESESHAALAAMSWI